MYVSLPKPAKRDCLVRSLGFKAVFRDLVSGSGFQISGSVALAQADDTTRHLAAPDAASLVGKGLRATS